MIGSMDYIGKLVRFILVNTLLISTVYSQQTKDVSIVWGGAIKLPTLYGEYLVPNFNNCTFEGNELRYSSIEELKGNYDHCVLVNFESEPAENTDLDFLEALSIDVPNQLEYDIRVSSARSDKFLVVEMNPYVLVNEEVRRITNFQLEFINNPSSPVQQKSFATVSALSDGSGYWCKLSVLNDGIYKIDYDQLSTILEGSGYDINSINPEAINIFGNGEGLLPEGNWKERTDDLAKNAIEIVGDADGSFDPGDYILFYARGPHRWQKNGLGKFERIQHIYSDQSIYFVNINPNDTPSRIISASGAVGAVTHSVSSYDYFARHEYDLVNLVSGGQKWYGELFDGSNLIQQFNFTVPNPDPTGEAYVLAYFGTNTRTSNTDVIKLYLNNSLLLSENIPGVGTDYKRYYKELNALTPAASMNVKIEVNRSSPEHLNYLDYITLNARSQLKMTGGQFGFRDLASVGAGNVASYTIGNANSSVKVWEVTDWQNPSLVNGSLSGSNYSFDSNADSLKWYVAFDGSTFYTPGIVGPVSYQNLHGLDQAEYIIITPSEFASQANRLADLHRDQGTTVHVVTPDLIYNEFSSGMPDATAFKFFAKMFYDRGAIDPVNRIENLLLFGDGTFDPKNRVDNNNNWILAYEVPESESHIGATVADDYYGMLDDGDGNTAGDLLDIGVGRLLISDNDMARQQVDKIEHYMKNGSDLFQNNSNICGSSSDPNSTFGDWRTRHIMIADDGDDGEAVFVNSDSEENYYYLKQTTPEINVGKTYLDAYPQIITAGGQRYPDVNKRIDTEMQRGCLSMIYVGHGGEVGVAEERVITVPQIQAWDNIHGMPLMVSATCEFTKFDDPSRVSAGEWASINPNGGAIALMTSTRSIFFNTNSAITDAFYREVFTRDSDMMPRRFGDIISSTKNQVTGTNKRSFTLIGDPALRIALPHYKIVTDSINSLDPLLTADTLMALSTVTIKGHVEDQFGNVLSGYNGVVSPTVFDKPKWYQTLQNDPSSPLVDFELINSKIYKGKASVVNGYFEFSFVVPKDILYSVGKGKISYYANDDLTDGVGFDTTFYVGGVDPNGINDTQGPDIEVFMNSENFVNGGTTGESPMLLVKLFDENGINATGSGIGHDLIGVLDGNSGEPLVLNDFYESNLDTYQSGQIRYNLSGLEAGPHSINVKVWDVNNNSSEANLEFVVQESSEVHLDHVINYPNPFTTSTDFYFEHNQTCCDIDVQIQIFTVAGRLVKTINENQQVDGYRSAPIHWDGKDDFGDQLAKGVYVYRVKVRTPDGLLAEETEKLVLLR